MAIVIVRLAEDKYVEWSTVCDAPASTILTRYQMLQFLNVYQPKANNEVRLSRADTYGTSLLAQTSLEEIIAGNRAGPNESCLSLNEIIERYR